MSVVELYVQLSLHEGLDMKDVAVVEFDNRGVLFDSDEVYIGNFGLWDKRPPVDEAVGGLITLYLD